MSPSSPQVPIPEGAYQGHTKNKLGLLPIDEFLQRVGPGTPGGEFLRRHWMPIAMSSMLGDLPLRLRRLGEDLVLFRSAEAGLGLLHLNCSHRNTSLEFGIVEKDGIRCCYHG